MAVERRPLQSSMLAGMEYDPATKTLTVTFRSGREYTYEGIDEDIAKGLAESPSPGKYFNDKIKGR
jgi:hypothetical protein